MTGTGPHLFVVLGATGDLTARKLLPALHHNLSGDPRSAVLGVASGDLGDAGFRENAAAALTAAGIGDAPWARERIYYQRVGRDEGFGGLAARIRELEAELGLPGNRVFYLAQPPEAFPGTIAALGEAGLERSAGWTRLVIEKPFGRDLESACELNRALHRHFDEPQVYRIDHYLGKETVQNLLVFRFTNPLFEASWNRDRIDRVEITVAEAVDVGTRGGYYDRAGAVRDMIQSHLTQVLTLIAMEAPPSMEPDRVRDEKVKVLRAMKPADAAAVVLGQYGAGGATPAYRSLDGVDPASTTPTYAAIRLFIDNWRWQGVPFYLRTGKALPERLTRIAITFRPPPVCLFHAEADDCVSQSDVLYLTLQPDEGFDLEIEVKQPGDTPRLRSVPLRFRYAEAFGEVPDAYTTLLRDVIEGDQTLFVRADEVEESWRLFAPVLDPGLPVHPYPAGTWGPPAARDLLSPAPNWATGG